MPESSAKPAEFRTRCGWLRAGRRYRITYRCTNPGPDVETGTILGTWDGTIDPWGKLPIQVIRWEDGGSEPWGPIVYLFSPEFVRINRV